MGVLSTAYAVDAKTMAKITEDNELLGVLFGVDDGDVVSAVDEHHFEKHLEETIGILGDTGHPTIREALDFELAEDEPEYGGYDIRVVAPATVKAIAEELADATFADVKEKALAKGVTDYYGKTIPEDDYRYYIGGLDDLKAFFAKAAAAEHFLIVAAA